jgi:hypothetical protein
VPTTDSTVDAEYLVERIRDTTREDQLAMRKTSDAAFILPPPGAARLNRVVVTTPRGSIVLPWESRDALLDEIRHLDSARGVIDAFEKVGASRPVELERADVVLLVQAIDVMMSNAGGPERLPAGIFELRNALLDDLHDTSA